MGRRKAKDAETPIMINSIEEAEEIIIRYKQSIAEIEECRHKAEIELACLEKTAELIKKGQGFSLEGLKNKEKALVVDALRKRFRLKELLPVLPIGKSSYCYCNKATGIDMHERLRMTIRRLFEENDDQYGYRHHLLKREGMTVSKKVVRHIMEMKGLQTHS